MLINYVSFGIRLEHLDSPEEIRVSLVWLPWTNGHISSLVSTLLGCESI